LSFELQRARGADANELLAALKKMAAEGIDFVLLDLPAELAARIADTTAGLDLLLFNVSATDDILRLQQCRAHLLHVVPNDAMLSDALAQYLVSRKWREVLMLVGPTPEDAALAVSFERSARRFGLRINDRRPFVLGTDPRQRQQNNVALLTGGADYDVVFVADADGEFARSVPYQTLNPRPVVGSAGLAPLAWHWSWERHGAPQLNKRFKKQAGRHMTGYDWSAWLAVKSIVEAVMRTERTDFQTLVTYLRGTEIILDGFKGNRLSFRPWDNQLRQPVLLASDNWVAERAPIRGFLHRTNNLDTLGFDEQETRCNP
jgi:ABC transporter substrate binding protein (PQQ-dependent alcohol dehydrogenase system)